MEGKRDIELIFGPVSANMFCFFHNLLRPKAFFFFSFFSCQFGGPRFLHLGSSWTRDTTVLFEDLYIYPGFQGHQAKIIEGIVNKSEAYLD